MFPCKIIAFLRQVLNQSKYLSELLFFVVKCMLSISHISIEINDH